MDALAATHDAAVQMIDTSIVRVHQHGASLFRNNRQSMGRSRGGLTSKIHAVVDSNGLPVRLALTAGEPHDNRLAAKLSSRLKSGAMLLADRGYDADWIRAMVSNRGAWANLPPRRNRKDALCFSPYLYRARNLVERFFNKIKQCRRVATRYDKLAANDLAFIQLASIRLWLRANESTQIRREAQAGTFALDADCIQSINERIARSLGMDAGIFRNKEGWEKMLSVKAESSRKMVPYGIDFSPLSTGITLQSLGFPPRGFSRTQSGSSITFLNTAPR